MSIKWPSLIMLLLLLGGNLEAGTPRQAEPFTLLDISAYCNMGFKEDDGVNNRKGGWMDNGPYDDIRDFPAGTREFANIKFNIIDPEKNQGKSCIIFKWDKLGPNEVSIQANEKADFVYLIHTTAWTGGKVAGELRLLYEDDTIHTIPIVIGKDVKDWHGPEELKNAKVGWVGKTEAGHHIAMYVSKFKNPNPGKLIRKINLFNKDCPWGILGITLSRKDIEPVSTAGEEIMEIKWPVFGNMGKLEDFEPRFMEKATTRKFSLKGYKLGMGGKRLSAGRFGWMKGDGLLDCGMSRHGIVDRIYLMHHEKYRAPYRWKISFLPPNTKNEKEEFRDFERVPDWKEDVQINWITARWSALYSAYDSYFERPKGKKIKFKIIYSIASPGIIIETSDPAMNVDLSKGPKFHYIALPLKEGIIVRETTRHEEIYSKEKDGELTDNWVFLWGSPTFPDIPMLLVLEKKPQKIICSKVKNLLHQLIIYSPPQTGYIIHCSPFGIEMFEPGETAKEPWLKDALKRARFWSKALLAYPEDCEEYYRVDEESSQVDVIQDYSYHMLSNEWNSEPIVLAPLPPAISTVVDKEGRFVKIEPNAGDLEFFTKYGKLRAVIGSNQVCFTLTIPPLFKKVPLKPKGEKFFEYEIDPAKPFSTWPIPQYAGNLNRNLWYFSFLKKDTKDTIVDWTKQWLLLGLLDERFLESEIGKGLIKRRKDKEVKSVAELAGDGWFKRTEPYTKQEYLLTFAYPKPKEAEPSTWQGVYHDQPWGSGKALYDLALAGLFTGDWQSFKKNWHIIEDAFRYYSLFFDWATLTEGNHENWEGPGDRAGYGAYMGYTILAEGLQNKEAYEYGLYLFSKYAVNRISSLYYWTFWDEGVGFIVGEKGHTGRPWLKDKRDLTQPSKWLTGITGNEFCYPEPVNFLYQFAPKETKLLINSYPKLYPNWYKGDFVQKEIDTISHGFGGPNTFAVFMMRLANDEIPTETLEKEMEEIEAEKTFADWKGIPACLMDYAKTLILTRDDPIWLEFWSEMCIDSAIYDRAKGEAILEVNPTNLPLSLQLGARKAPIQILLSEKKMANVENLEAVKEGWLYSNRKIKMKLLGRGILRIKL